MTRPRFSSADFAHLFPGASAARRAGSRKATRAGKAFEQLVSISGRGIVHLIRIPDGARRIGKGIVATKSPFDFAGVFCGSGRGLFFDAKSLESASGFAMANPKILKRHQFQLLWAMARSGAVAGLLVRSRVGILWLDVRRITRLETVPWDDDRWIRMGEKVPDWGVLASRYARNITAANAAKE